MSADKDLISVQQARDLVEAAHRAQAEIARFDQAKIDRICDAMAKAAMRDSPRTAALAVEETGYGIPEDKHVKNQFSAEIVWNYFKPLRTVGVVSETKDVVEIASPRGVVAGIIPSTNPTSTAIFKVLIAIKSRNAIVLSPHPSAARCAFARRPRGPRRDRARRGLPVPLEAHAVTLEWILAAAVVVLLVVLAYHLRHLRALHRWLEKNDTPDPPRAHGLWDRVHALLHRWRRESAQRGILETSARI